MSIQDRIDVYEQTNVLRRVYPSRPKRTGRYLYLYGDIWERCEVTRPRHPRAWTTLRNILQNFADGMRMDVRPRGTSYDWHKPSEVAQLKPYEQEIWEIRCLFSPTVGVRVYGRFYKQNRFVGFHCHYKEALLADEAARAASAQCLATWEQLFPGEPALSDEDHPDAYLTRTRVVA